MLMIPNSHISQNYIIMKKLKPLIIIQLAISLFLLVTSSYAQDNIIFTKAYIADIIDKVNTYQLKNPWTKEDFNWIRGTYYTGVMACYQATGIDKYLLQCNAWGKSCNWGIPFVKADAEASGANVMTCSQTW